MSKKSRTFIKESDLIGCENCHLLDKCNATMFEEEGEEPKLVKEMGFPMTCVVQMQQVCKDCKRECKSVFIEDSKQYPTLVHCPKQIVIN